MYYLADGNGLALACILVESTCTAAAGEFHIRSIHTRGAPAPHVTCTSEFALWIQLLHCTAEVAPGVWICDSSIKALLMFWPSSFSPVETCITLVDEEVYYLAELGVRLSRGNTQMVLNVDCIPKSG